jgi:hypothetical protein
MLLVLSVFCWNVGYKSVANTLNKGQRALMGTLCGPATLRYSFQLCSVYARGLPRIIVTSSTVCYERPPCDCLEKDIKKCRKMLQCSRHLELPRDMLNTSRLPSVGKCVQTCVPNSHIVLNTICIKGNVSLFIWFDE